MTWAEKEVPSLKLKEEMKIEKGLIKNKKWIDLYWKLEWLRKLLGKFLTYRCYKNEGRSYILSVIWSFICGCSLMDSFYYDFRTPDWIKEVIKRIKKVLYV